MKNTITPIFFSIFFFTIIQSQAQIHFYKGFIIKNNQDTVNGFIGFQSNLKNYAECIFKISEDTQELIFKPGELKSYFYDKNKFYISKKIKTDTTIRNIFLEVIFEGQKKLYYFSDINNSFYLIEDENRELIKLAIQNKIVTDQNKNYNFVYKEYIGLLKIIFKDYTQLFPFIEKTTLTHSSLIKLLERYQKMIGMDNYNTYFVRKDMVNIGFGGYSLYNSNKINVYEGHYDVPYDNYSYPSYGISIDISLPRLNENIAVQLNGDIGKINYYYSNTQSSSLGEYLYEYQIDAKLLNFCGGIKYVFPTKNIKPYAILGLSISKLNDLSTNRCITITYNSSDQKIKEVNDIEITDSYSGLYLSTGAYLYNKNSRRLGELKIEYKNLKGEGFETIVEMNVFSLGIGIYLL